MTPEDFRDMIARVRASEGQPLDLQERVDIVPPWLMKEGETPAEALARAMAEAEASNVEKDGPA